MICLCPNIANKDIKVSFLWDHTKNGVCTSIYDLELEKHLAHGILCCLDVSNGICHFHVDLFKNIHGDIVEGIQKTSIIKG
jgi:hypothetical protein